MKILFLTAHIPSPVGRLGGQKTSYHICEFLSRRHDMDLLSFGTENELASFDGQGMGIFHCWDVIPVTRWTRLHGVLSTPQLPLAVAARSSQTFRKRLRHLTQTHRFDAVILDHTAMWQYADQIGPTPIRVGSAHDVLSQAWERKAQRCECALARSFLRMEQKRVYSWEKKSLTKLNLVAPHCDKDGRLLRQMNPLACVIPIRAWFGSLPNTFSNERERGSIVFFGAFDRSENCDAAEYAVKQILPLIREQYSDFRFYIAGNHSDKLGRFVAGLSDVILTGFIEDAPQFLSRMQIALVPLRIGAGVKIKTLECMAAGLSVVTTPVGAEGVEGEDGVHYVLGGTPRELADQTVRLLKEPSISRMIGERAREFVFEAFDFEKELENLCSLIDDRLVVSRVMPSEAFAK